jgi:hypothetical protein
MAHQATLNTDPVDALNGMLSGIGDLGSNVITLATLQAQLAAEDLRESTDRLQPALIASALLVPLGFGGVTVGLLALANWMANQFGLTVSQSLLLTALLALAVAGGLAVVAIRRLRVSFTSFQRSREELERNIAWLRTVLMHSGR